MMGDDQAASSTEHVGLAVTVSAEVKNNPEEVSGPSSFCMCLDRKGGECGVATIRKRDRLGRATGCDGNAVC